MEAMNLVLHVGKSSDSPEKCSHFRLPYDSCHMSWGTCLMLLERISVASDYTVLFGIWDFDLISECWVHKLLRYMAVAAGKLMSEYFVIFTIYRKFMHGYNLLRGDKINNHANM